MRVLVGIGHPAHVHFYHNAIDVLRKHGHDVKVITKPRQLAIDLLQQYGIEFEVCGNSKVQQDSSFRTALSFISFELDVLNTVRRYKPSVVTGIGNVPLSHASSIFGCDSVIFTDTEHPTLQNSLVFPFADRVCTPECFENDIGEKQVQYPGYHELAYLHPNRYEPDTDRLEECGVQTDNQISVVRFVGWGANHDVGHEGFSPAAKKEIVSLLDDVGDVYISAEADLPPELEEYQLSLPPHLVHDLLATADYYIGDSGTMATEAALLGTPSIRSNSFVENDNPGVFQELQNKYDLVYTTADEREAIRKLREFVESDDVQRRWEQKRSELLDDKIDTTDFILEQLHETASSD